MNHAPPPNLPSQRDDTRLERERYEALHQIEDWLETPVMILGVIWLVLLVIDLTRGLSGLLNPLMFFIWGVFIVEFLIRFLLAPRKLAFLRANWLTALSLLIPALRVGRLARVLRLARGLRGARMVSLLGSVNRGMRMLRATLRQNAFGYVLLLTALITLLGAAGIYAFEGPGSGGSIGSYGEAVWWTSMIMTSLGSETWPVTAEGRLLAFLLALYALAMFGYVTATLATFFIGRNGRPAEPSAPAVIPETGTAADGARALREEIAALRLELAAFKENAVAFQENAATYQENAGAGCARLDRSSPPERADQPPDQG